MSATSGFLKFGSKVARVHITADDTEFDPVTFQHWKDEGFEVQFHPFDPATTPENVYLESIRHLADNLELGEYFALVAYGRAASLCIHLCQKPVAHLAALVAYYPDVVPASNAKLPSQLQIVCHLSGNQNFSPSFKSYRYPGTVEGFAEWDLDEFDKPAARLSWTRSLACVRRGFNRDFTQEMETIAEDRSIAKFTLPDVSNVIRPVTDDSFLTNVPTLTGGMNKQELTRFYGEFFLKSHPPTLKTKLLSRTIGVDRVVDELFVTFRHTQEVPWLLPGVPPTNKPVEIVIISIIGVRGGKLTHENVYWDQASVLVQIGLLDPKAVPDNLKSKGMKRLPVIGKEAARKVLDEEIVRCNDLIPNWDENQKKLPIRNGRQKHNGKGKGPAHDSSTPVQKGKGPVENNATNGE